MSGEASPRFIVDAMLGRLARWLRVLGYDALYFSDLEDAALYVRARTEDRILLTRDRELARRKGVRVILIGDDRVEAQVRQVVRTFGLSTANAFTRCIECNAVLGELPREEAQPLVPPFVFTTQTRFRRCPECGRVYWRGTHWAHMVQDLESEWDSER